VGVNHPHLSNRRVIYRFTRVGKSAGPLFDTRRRNYRVVMAYSLSTTPYSLALDELAVWLEERANTFDVPPRTSGPTEQLRLCGRVFVVHRWFVSREWVGLGGDADQFRILR